MEKIKIDLNRYNKIAEENKNKRIVQPWQDYAAKVCKDFELDQIGRGAVFKYAKKNLSYLQGKVEMCREKFGDNLKGKGNYLVKLFSKKRPWEK